jgi:CheY-like chemotaxis protein
MHWQFEMTGGERRKSPERRQTGAHDGSAFSVRDVPHLTAPQERRTFERRRQDRNGHFLERRQLPRPQRVLVVDDDGDVRDVWREWLTMWRFQVEEAENGSVAVEKARERQPALVIMDLTMPVLDGLSATKELRRDPATARIPVLLLSADISPSAPERALRAGCEAFLAKPIQPRDLLEEIRRTFRRIIAERMPPSC